MTARSVNTLLCAAALALAALAPAAARASASDAFEHKVPPVSGQLSTKAGKLELAPLLSLTMNDAFFSKYLVGGRIAYHFSNTWSVGLNGAYAFANEATGSTSVCDNTGCHPADPAQLYQVPGYLRYVVGAEIGFAPVYGKLNVFAEKAIHFDLSLLAGPDLVAYRDVIPPGSTAVPGDVTTFGGHLGLGARVFLGRSVALTLDVRDLMYSVSALTQGGLQNQLFAQLGVSFFVPISSQDAQ